MSCNSREFSKLNHSVKIKLCTIGFNNWIIISLDGLYNNNNNNNKFVFSTKYSSFDKERKSKLRIHVTSSLQLF